MKTIGLMGGMSWESTVTYYQLLNRMARDALGGLHSASLVLYSFDFAEIEALQAAEDWEAATRRMVAAARSLELAGAECLMICTNTMHRMAAEVQAGTNVPLIHIADATAAAIRATRVSAPLLLATRYTMEQDFYRGRLRNRHGIETVIPDDAARALVHDIIYHELCQGIVSASSKASMLDVIAAARADGADGVILGCTELGLLLGAGDLDIPVFDTTALHARAALDFALQD